MGKNILIIGDIHPSCVGGKERYNINLMNAFANDDSYNFFYVYKREEKNGDDYNYESILFKKPIKRISFKNTFLKIIFLIPFAFIDFINDIFFYIFLKKIIKTNNINLIINSEVYDLSSKFLSCPVLNVQHLNDKYYKNMPNIFSKLKIRTSFNNPIVVFSEESYKAMNLSCKYFVINTYYDGKPHEASYKNKKIISVSRISKLKNIDFLKRVSDRLEKEHNIKIYFYGPDDINLFENNSKNYKGSKTQEEMEKIYNDSKILVHASSSEGLPLVLIEAMAHGIPCIVYNSFTTAKYLIGNNERGFLIDEINEDLFVDKILELYYLDNKKYKSISKNCFNFIEKNFNKDEFKKKWENVFLYFFKE